MRDTYGTDRSGSRTIRYAIFLCAASVLFVSAIAFIGEQYKTQLTAWHQGVEVDYTAVGSIANNQQVKSNNSIIKEEIDADNVKTYRVYQLPKGLQPE